MSQDINVQKETVYGHYNSVVIHRSHDRQVSELQATSLLKTNAENYMIGNDRQTHREFDLFRTNIDGRIGIDHYS